MNIKQIMSSSTIIENAVDSAIKNGFYSDVPAAKGAILEKEICIEFNKINDKFKLLPKKMVELVHTKINFDFSCYAKSKEELFKKTQESFGILSASDLFLFEVVNNKYILNDFASIKSSLNPKSATSVYVHNDPKGEIHDSLRNNINLDKVIGNIFIIVSRKDKCKNRIRVYHYNDNLGVFRGKCRPESSRNKKDVEYFYGGSKIFKTTSRENVGNKKSTSFDRGIKIHSRKKPDEFYCFEQLELNMLVSIERTAQEDCEIFDQLYHEFHLLV